MTTDRTLIRISVHPQADVSVKKKKKITYFDRNTATTCNFSPCTPCRRSRCTGCSGSWACPRDRARCCKSCIVFSRPCKIYHRVPAPDDRTFSRQSRHQRRNFWNTRSSYPIRPIPRLSDSADRLLAHTPDSGTTAKPVSRR